MFEPLIIVVSKDEVLSGDILPALGSLKKLIESPKIAKSFKEKMEIAFHGYNKHPEELF